MVSLLSKGAPLCLHSGLLKLCDCDWNLAIDREIATFCFCPTSNALKKKNLKIVQQKLYSSINPYKASSNVT